MPLSPLRPALAAILVAFVAAATLFSSPTPGYAAPTHPIAVRALDDLGTWQGECFIWVKKVVYEATGKQIGFGYRDGYLEAGAIEVSVADAQAGDIIQIVNDDWDGPGADYDGLHTAIILENNGDGTFDAIDSNQKWDGIVRLRPNYDPATQSRLKGIDFHIYRITGEAPSGERSPSPAPEVVAKGDRATVNTPGECLRMRDEPGGDIVSCLPHGTDVIIVSAPVTALGIQWVQVQTAAGTGWMAAQYLEVSNTTSAAGPVGDSPVLPFRAFIPFAAAD